MRFFLWCGPGRVALDGLRPSDCPDNAPISGIAQGIATALRLYKQEKKQGTSTSLDERRVGCLFLVQPNEGNAFDQYHLEFELWGKHEVPHAARDARGGIILLI